jgi:hypothetical protein
VRWAYQDLNLGPHPYQQSPGQRCADQGLRSSRSTVMGEVIGSEISARVGFCHILRFSESKEWPGPQRGS